MSNGWWIVRGQNLVCIDDALIRNVDCSSIPKNIYLVFWYGTHGEILYNHDDRLPVREPFTDFAPYVGIFDAWMRAAQRERPPISLTQARFVKSKMVDALMPDGRMHKNRIAGMETVDEIAAYDITQGW